MSEILLHGPSGWVPAVAPLELLATQEVSGAAVDTLSFVGLDGDVQKIYLMVFDILFGSASASLRLRVRPNGLTTDQASSLNSGSDGGFGAIGDAFLTIAFFDTLRERVAGQFDFWARTGSQRMLNARASVCDSTPAAATCFKSIAAGIWADTVTNIASLDLVTTNAAGALITGFGVGSRVSLYSMPG